MASLSFSKTDLNRTSSLSIAGPSRPTLRTVVSDPQLSMSSTSRSGDSSLRSKLSPNTSAPNTSTASSISSPGTVLSQPYKEMDKNVFSTSDIAEDGPTSPVTSTATSDNENHTASFDPSTIDMSLEVEFRALVQQMGMRAPTYKEIINGVQSKEGFTQQGEEKKTVEQKNGEERATRFNKMVRVFKRSRVEEAVCS